MSSSWDHKFKLTNKKHDTLKENEQSVSTFNHSLFDTEIMVSHTKLFDIVECLSFITELQTLTVRVLRIFSDGELFEPRTHPDSRTSILLRRCCKRFKTSVAVFSLHFERFMSRQDRTAKETFTRPKPDSILSTSKSGCAQRRPELENDANANRGELNQQRVKNTKEFCFAKTERLTRKFYSFIMPDVRVWHIIRVSRVWKRRGSCFPHLSRVWKLSGLKK